MPASVPGIVTQFALIPTDKLLVWACKSTPPAQEAGQVRFKTPPETVVVIAGGGETETTETDPSTARWFTTVKPGETMVIPAPPLTG